MERKTVSQEKERFFVRSLRSESDLLNMRNGNEIKPNNGRPQMMSLYATLISCLGIGLLAYAFWQQPWDMNFPLLIRLVALAGLAQFVATVSKRSKVSFSVAEVTGLVAGILASPWLGVLVVTVSSLSIWIIKKFTHENWRGTFIQLAFNTAMQILSVLAAVFAFQFVSGITASWGFLGTVLSWGVAGIVVEAVNFILLAIIINLQSGQPFGSFWQENSWSVPINVVLNALGGNLLVFAIGMVGYRGVELFALPLFFTAYSYYIYVTKTEESAELLEAKDAQLRKLIESLPETISRKELESAVLKGDQTSHIFQSLISPSDINTPT